MTEHMVTRLTQEQRDANEATLKWFQEGGEFHTGHLPYLELPTYACLKCFEEHPESHIKGL